MDYNVAKMVSYRASYTCQICYKSRYNKMYEYQAYSYVPRYKPEYFTKVCGDCVYKSVYGHLWKIKKKEGVLDSDLRSM